MTTPSTDPETLRARAAEIARKIGSAQKRVILSLSSDWGPSADHRAAKRLWYRTDIPILLDHRHRTDNCWSLRPIGLAVREYLQGNPHDD